MITRLSGVGDAKRDTDKTKDCATNGSEGDGGKGVKEGRLVTLGCHLSYRCDLVKMNPPPSYYILLC